MEVLFLSTWFLRPLDTGSRIRVHHLLRARYPELRGKLPFARDFEAIDLKRDNAAALYRKLRVRALALPPVRGTFYALLTLLERRQCQPRLAKILYWRLAQAMNYVGFREGCSLAPVRQRVAGQVHTR